MLHVARFHVACCMVPCCILVRCACLHFCLLGLYSCWTFLPACDCCWLGCGDGAVYHVVCCMMLRCMLHDACCTVSCWMFHGIMLHVGEMCLLELLPAWTFCLLEYFACLRCLPAMM